MRTRGARRLITAVLTATGGGKFNIYIFFFFFGRRIFSIWPVDFGVAGGIFGRGRRDSGGGPVARIRVDTRYLAPGRLISPLLPGVRLVGFSGKF